MSTSTVNLPKVANAPGAAPADPALEPCDQTCVPEFRKNTDESVRKECDAEQVASELCFREEQVHRDFFSAINWRVLRESIQSYFQMFFESLQDDLEFLQDLKAVYTFSPYVPPNTKSGKRPENYAEFNLEIVNGDDYKFCNNLILKIELVRGVKNPAGTGKRRRVIAHISLHPLKPKYYRDTLRSRSGCGYYRKLTNANRALRPEDTSPFMYTIELIDWKGHEIKDESPFRVKKPLQPNPATPGTFLPIDGPFQRLFQEGFTNGADRSTDPLTAEKLQLLNSVHMRLYSKFVEFWNSTMLEGFPGVASGSGAIVGALPSIRQMGGAARKRRTQKHKRKNSHRTRKH